MLLERVMSADKAYYFRVGSRRVPFMYFKEGSDGSEYVIFPMDRAGFKISTHPFADPHMRDERGFKHHLDLASLRSMNWDEISKVWEPWWNSLFYWPAHRADLIAIPGPPGKSWFEGLQELLGQEEMDLIALLRLALGSGTIYKVGYGSRKAFFETSLGRGSVIIDHREGRFGAYVGGPNPDRPLLGLRWDEGGLFAAPMPGPLQTWKEALEVRIETAMEQYMEDARNQMEAALLEALPDIEAFFEHFKIVRWKPGAPHTRLPEGINENGAGAGSV